MSRSSTSRRASHSRLTSRRAPRQSPASTRTKTTTTSMPATHASSFRTGAPCARPTTRARKAQRSRSAIPPRSLTWAIRRGRSRFSTRRSRSRTMHSPRTPTSGTPPRSLTANTRFSVGMRPATLLRRPSSLTTLPRRSRPRLRMAPSSAASSPWTSRRPMPVPASRARLRPLTARRSHQARSSPRLPSRRARTR